MTDPLATESANELESRRAFVDHWRSCTGRNGHDMIANRNTVRRFIGIIDGLVDRIAALSAPAGWLDDALANRDLVAPASHFRNELQVIPVDALRSLKRHHEAAPAGCVGRGLIVVEEASCVPHSHPELGVGMFFTDAAMLATPPAAVSDPVAGVVAQLTVRAETAERVCAALRRNVADLSDRLAGQATPEGSS